MSYKSLDLDFTDIHVACLSGENGAGKSTILDAITWCIWEKSRASQNDDLIKLGEAETNAELIFDIDEQRYKIIRNLKKSGKKKISVQSTIELQIFSDNGYRSITGKSVTETRARIIEIVKMEYDTFVNSAFVLQGKADAFTMKKPSERKQLLAEILNLEQYSILQIKAKEKLKNFTDEKTLIGRENEHILIKIKDEESIAQQLANAENKLPEIEIKKTEIEEKISQNNEKKQELNIKLSAMNQVKKILLENQSNFQQIETRIINLERNALSYEEYISRKEEIETKYNDLISLKTKEQSMSEKLIESSNLEKKIAELRKNVDNKKHKLEIEITDINGKIHRLDKDKKEADKIVSEEEKILTNLSQLKKLKEEQIAYQDKVAKYTKLTDKKVYLEKKINEELNKLKLDENGFKTKLKEREDKISRKRIIQSEIDKLKKISSELIVIQDKLNSITETGLGFKAHIENNKKLIEAKLLEIKSYDEKIERWSHVAGDNCPMCDSFLSDDEKKFIIEKYKSQIELVETEIATLDVDIIKTEKKRADFVTLFKQLSAEKKEKEGTEKKLGEYENVLDDILSFEKEIIPIKRELQNISEKISSRNFNPEVQKELLTVNDDLKQLDYNAETISVIQAKISSLEYVEIKYSQLETAKKKLAQINKELPDLILAKQNNEDIIEKGLFAKSEIKEIEQLKKSLDLIGYNSSEHSQLRADIVPLNIYEDENQKLQKSINAITPVKEQISSLKIDLLKLEKSIQEGQEEIKYINDFENKLKELQDIFAQYSLEKNIINKEENEVRAEIYRNKEKLDNISLLKKEIEDSQEKYDFLDKEISLYKDLTEAFGKNGIQSIIIENAIPEIENYANQILTQMTEGRMNIKFSTIKTNKSNDNLRETLDIYISDELGTRNYEMYSGGEAFRVNFAIRLALSKMLAKRAGTKLKTLVIDEGFGTQDSKGISRLIESIKAIERDFEKILIITHINDLKEAFPVRIEVFKTIHGSEIRLVS